MDIGERISQTVQVDQDAGWDGLQLHNYNKIWRKLDLRNRNSRKENRTILLLKQAENFLLNNENYRIKNFFDCQNPRDSISEFFYIIANLYSNEKDYQLSNFYLKISLFLNDKFLPNKSLLAENYQYQKKNIDAKKTYESLKSIGSVYSWYASKSIAAILLQEKGKKHSVKSLEKEFNLLISPNFHREVSGMIK